MAIGYQYRRISNFNFLELNNVGDIWENGHQYALGLPEDDDEVHSSITFQGLSDNPDFYKYFVKHETMRHQKARFENIVRDKFIGIEEFHIYIPKNYTYLFAGTKYPFCNELLKKDKTIQT